MQADGEALGSAQTRQDDAEEVQDAGALKGQTLVVYLGPQTLPHLMHDLVARGAGPSTPAMAVENGTTEHERRVFSPMHLLPDAVKSAELRSPTLVVICEVVSLPKEWRARDESWTEVGKKSARRWPHTHADAAQLGAEAATTASVVGGSRRGSTRTRSVVDTRRVPVPGSSTASEWMYTSVIVTHLLLVMTGEYFTVVVF